jgi:hypothetical protein
MSTVDELTGHLEQLGFPVALAASDEDGLVQLVDQPIEGALDRLLAAAAPPRMEISAARVHDWISGT